MGTYTLAPDTKAFFFDVFGTCVDWRKSVTNELVAAFSKAAGDASAAPPPAKDAAGKLTRQDCGEIAAQWRKTYYDYVRKVAADPSTKFKTVDEHHYDALLQILEARGLTGLFTETELQHLAYVWHRLDSWPDTNEGLKIMGKNHSTCTLSNGNVSLLKDMQNHSGMPFTHTFSSEMFGTYKPNPKVYHGGAGKLDINPEQAAMVAAHLLDLKAAKGCGLQTIYVERPGEEDIDMDQARREGYVDLWITEDQDGFLAVTRALGLS